MSTPRVLLYTDTLLFAGTERHILDLAKSLARSGCQATVGCQTSSALAARAAGGDIALELIPGSALFNWTAIKLLTKHLQYENYDVIHAHNGRTHLTAVLAVLLARRGTCVFTQHFLEPRHRSESGLKAYVHSQIHRMVNAKTSRFIAISNAVRGCMLQRDDAPDSKIDLIWNGVPDPLEADIAPKNEVRLRFGVAPDALLVFCAARLEKEKNVTSLIEAILTVRSRLPSVKCLVAGDGQLKAELQLQIESSDLQNCVTLLGFQDGVISLMHAADLFVLPSINEPFGLVLAEAMAVAKPIVACRSGGAAEIVVHGETGLLISPGRTDALVQAILQILEDPKLATGYGAAGRRRWSQFFTTANMAAKTFETYISAYDARRSRRRML